MSFVVDIQSEEFVTGNVSESVLPICDVYMFLS